MADLKAVVPYHDPHDTDIDVLSDYILPDFSDEFSINDLLNQASDPSFQDISLNPTNDTYVQEILNDFLDAPIDDHSLDFNSLLDGEMKTVQPMEIGYNVEPLVAPSAAPISCDFCHVVGEMVHTDGIEMSRLEIHGISGMINHGIVQVHSCPNSVPVREFIDFCHMDAESVMQILDQYNESRRLAGFTLLNEDHVLVPFAAPSIDDYQYLKNDQNVVHQSPVNFGNLEVESSEPQQNILNASVLNKTALAVQRERSSRMTLDDFVDYFHLPIEKAAKELGVCATVVKKICRKHGLVRWPHRKIKSLKRRLETLKHKMENVTDGRERDRLEIEKNLTMQQIDHVRREAAAGKL